MSAKKGLLLFTFTIVAFSISAQMGSMYDVDGLTTSAAVKSLVRDDILTWINNPIVVEAVREANREHRNRTQVQIRAADQRWRAARGVDNFIRPYLENPAAMFLRAVQAESGGIYAEIFVMDYQGVNVAQTNKTSDLWQGDEDKFTESYLDGEGAIHVGDVEFDESTGAYLIQVSLPIYDDRADAVIGAVTVGIDMTKL